MFSKENLTEFLCSAFVHFIIAFYCFYFWLLVPPVQVYPTMPGSDNLPKHLFSVSPFKTLSAGYEFSDGYLFCSTYIVLLTFDNGIRFTEISCIRV